MTTLRGIQNKKLLGLPYFDVFNQHKLFLFNSLQTTDCVQNPLAHTSERGQMVGVDIVVWSSAVRVWEEVVRHTARLLQLNLTRVHHARAAT